MFYVCLGIYGNMQRAYESKEERFPLLISNDVQKGAAYLQIGQAPFKPLRIRRIDAFFLRHLRP